MQTIDHLFALQNNLTIKLHLDECIVENCITILEYAKRKTESNFWLPTLLCLSGRNKIILSVY
jgi:hypothetical protein